MSKTETFVFNRIPAKAEELHSFAEADLQSPFKTAALTLIALCAFGENKEAVFEMPNYLKGPEPLSAYEKQFLCELVGSMWEELPEKKKKDTKKHQAG